MLCCHPVEIHSKGVVSLTIQKIIIWVLVLTVAGSFLAPVQAEMTVAPTPSSCKTYMDYRAITNTESEQWKLIQTLEKCEDGMLRDEYGFIAAALGSYFGGIGSRWLFFTEDGKIIPIVKTDAKQDRHTDSSNIYGSQNYDVIEFVIDGSHLQKEANGFIYWGNFNNCEKFEGAVVGWLQISE